ncbi:MAG TPA: hypothetical protein VGR57_11540 [Ktedonobacterales bacterium]|nr:hypothetical protein [Ktedonobacterales bacterium]
MSRKFLLVAVMSLALLACSPASSIGGGGGTPTPVAPTATPICSIAVILNHTTAQITYLGTYPTSASDVFLVVDVSFQNNCSTRQTLSPSWDLKDASGTHFSPLDPPQPIVLDPGESNQQTTAFQVPGAEGCHFTMNLIGVGDTQSWDLTCGS